MDDNPGHTAAPDDQLYFNFGDLGCAVAALFYLLCGIGTIGGGILALKLIL